MDPERLRQRARELRARAERASDRVIIEEFLKMAADCEATAERIIVERMPQSTP